VTSHGLAVNADLDLGVYELFDACGWATPRSRRSRGGRPAGDDRRPCAAAARALREAFELELEPLPAAACLADSERRDGRRG
jgi:lipoate-protein ligase B